MQLCGTPSTSRTCCTIRVSPESDIGRVAVFLRRALRIGKLPSDFRAEVEAEGDGGTGI
jgi:hypothetical protein